MNVTTNGLASSLYCEYMQNNGTFISNLTSNFTNLFNAMNSSGGSLMIDCNPISPKPEAATTDYAKIVARIFYIVVLLIGTIGNVLACYIIISRKFMRRVIHIYTFNLAVADLIVVLFYVPVEMVRNENDLKWTMGSAMCSLNYFATPTSLVASICTLVAITLDRHRGVTKPFLWRGDSRKVLKLTIPAIWFIALVSSAPLFFVAKLVPHNNSLYCIEVFPSRTAMKVYWITMFILQVLLPLGIIVAANTHMIWTMDRLSRQTGQTEHDEQNRQHRRMIRMVVLLVLVYAICSSPQHIVFFWFTYGDLEQHKLLSMYIFKAANLLVITQSAINPIIYGTGRTDFKRAFKAIFYCSKFREYLPTHKQQKSLLIREDKLSSNFNDVDTTNTHLTPEKIENNINNNKRNLKYDITDTPPVNRKFLDEKPRRRSEPTMSKWRNNSGARAKQKYLSMPNGRVASLRLGMKDSLGKLNGRPTPSNLQNTISVSLEVCIDELENLVNSPETIV